jgi:uncharacterized protein (DUF433 family)
MATETLSEAEKMRRVPGIGFMDGALGRRAHMAGSGIDVWEVIKTYRNLDWDYASLVEYYDWLTPAQVHAALDYYYAFPEEIDERLALEDALTPKECSREYQPRPAQLRPVER